MFSTFFVRRFSLLSGFDYTGTVEEFRSVCTQQLLIGTFLLPSFSSWYFGKFGSVKAYLISCSFFQEESRDYNVKGRKFSQKELTASETDHIMNSLKTLLPAGESWFISSSTRWE